MNATRSYRHRAGPRDLLFFVNPQRWPRRPFLPLIRLPADGPPEYGVLYDAVGTSGKFGLSATVYRVNLFAMPATEEAFLAVPHHSYDTAEEMADDGWLVD